VKEEAALLGAGTVAETERSTAGRIINPKLLGDCEHHDGIRAEYVTCCGPLRDYGRERRVLTTSMRDKPANGRLTMVRKKEARVARIEPDNGRHVRAVPEMCGYRVKRPSENLKTLDRSSCQRLGQRYSNRPRDTLTVRQSLTHLGH